MPSVKAALKWKEENYGLEYRHDVFNFLGVENFNMGAMENTTLNIYNVTVFVGNPRITTDAGLIQIEDGLDHEIDHYDAGGPRHLP